MSEGRLTTVVVGKIHVSEWAKSEFRTRLIDLLSTRKKYKRISGKGADKFFWTFTNYRIETSDDQTILFARMVKVKRQIKEVVFDEESWSPALMARETPNASLANFIIILEKRVIIFEELQSISIKLFAEMFSTMYGQRFSSEDLSKVWINPVVKKELIFEKLREFDKITRVKLVVTPSNPDTGDYRQLDELLKNSKTEEAALEFKNEEEGLTVENTIIGQGISLASAGYGYQNITAEKDGKKEVIKSKDEILRWRVPFTDDSEAFIKNLYQRYVDFIHIGETS